MARIEYRLRIYRRDGSSDETELHVIEGAAPGLAAPAELLRHVMSNQADHSIEITPVYVRAGGIMVLASDFARIEVVPVAIDQSMNLLLAERQAVQAAAAAEQEAVNLPNLVHGLASDGSVAIAGYHLERVDGDTWRFVA